MKRLLNLALTTILLVGFDGWFAIFSYADWLRFGSPKAPTLATGQVIYEKAVRGAFYITSGQAFWTQSLIFPIWLGVALSGFGLYLLNGRKTEPEGVPRWFWLCGVVIALLFWAFGDHMWALLTSGTLSIPPEPPLGPTAVP
jgi:hypothetical protein